MRFLLISFLFMMLGGCKSTTVSDKNLLLFFPDNLKQLKKLNYKETYYNGKDRYPVLLQKEINDTLISFLYFSDRGIEEYTKKITFRFDQFDSTAIQKKIRDFDTNFSDTSEEVNFYFNNKAIKYQVEKTDKSLSLVYN